MASSCTGRVNDQGELLAFCLTRGNVDDRRPIPKLAKRLFGDKGYLSQSLIEELLITQGVHRITKLRNTMRNRLMDLSDKLLLRKRAIIETITDQFKTSVRSSIFAIAAPSTSWSAWLPGSLPTAINPRNPRSGYSLSL